MSYFAPYLNSSGLHIPSYTDIINYYVAQAQSIFGSNIYIDNDSQDYQLLSMFASAASDAMGLCQLAVNNESPSTAIGSGLASIVKLNGLAKKIATYSTCAVTLTGAPGSTVTSGVVQDVSGYKWDLPTPIVFPAGGTIIVTATCETVGAITAAIGDIQSIVNNQYGWYSVTNDVAATAGAPIETDLALRTRQSVSVEAPSQTPFQGTLAAVAAVSDVTRYGGEENSTSDTDANGVPAHSIAVVVEGGTDSDIATAIANHKTTGCGTYGTTAVALPANYSISGNTCFSRPTYDTVAVDITVTPLTGYTSAIQAQLITNIQNYINALSIGTSVQASSLYYPALAAMADQNNASFAINSITVNLNGGAFGSSATIGWNEVAQAGAVTVRGGY